MALTPPFSPYPPTILAALTAAIARNPVTLGGRLLSINPSLITNPVTQDGQPYICNVK